MQVWLLGTILLEIRKNNVLRENRLIVALFDSVFVVEFVLYFSERGSTVFNSGKSLSTPPVLKGGKLHVAGGKEVLICMALIPFLLFHKE